MNKLLLYIVALFLMIPFSSALTSGEGAIVFGAIFSILIVVVFFLTLSIIINSEPMKLFFISLSFLSIIAAVGVGVSTLQEFFPTFQKLIASYSNFYILLITLSLFGLLALIIYMIILAFKSFYAYRGMADDE
ncbi:MAG: hypothetical protein ACTSQ4_02425 [Candidatus Heimdallarchaeaceae archaeon]